MHPTYTRTHPFIATLTDRHSLTKSTSSKTTMHLVLDISGSDMRYKVGDSIGIYPLNDPSIVNRILKALDVRGDVSITTKTGVEMHLQQFLSSKANLHSCSTNLVRAIVQRQDNAKKRGFLEQLLAEDQKDALKDYLEQRHVWDLLQENAEARLEPQELVGFLMPLLPRFYSIASSMMAVGEEIHLTVTLTQYETNAQRRLGVASHYLCHLAPLHEAVIPLYLQPSKDFTLPAEDATSIIMIGPGTGVAPYRGFMQERMLRGAVGRHWLFFGERHRATDFFYEEYWREIEARGQLRVDLAFSRDQADRIYVQHRMLERGAELYRWIAEGATVYVCGDASRMAKDVDQALQMIFKEHGHLDDQGASEALKNLRKEKRYLRDVY